VGDGIDHYAVPPQQIVGQRHHQPVRRDERRARAQRGRKFTFPSGMTIASENIGRRTGTADAGPAMNQQRRCGRASTAEIQHRRDHLGARRDQSIARFDDIVKHQMQPPLRRQCGKRLRIGVGREQRQQIVETKLSRDILHRAQRRDVNRAVA
jgi:hypothetical protein